MAPVASSLPRSLWSLRILGRAIGALKKIGHFTGFFTSIEIRGGHAGSTLSDLHRSLTYALKAMGDPLSYGPS
jgi:hypothetical protein